MTTHQLMCYQRIAPVCTGHPWVALPGTLLHGALAPLLHTCAACPHSINRLHRSATHASPKLGGLNMLRYPFNNMQPIAGGPISLHMHNVDAAHQFA
jgi:hypothetical protein